MKSIQTKFIALILACVLLSSLIIGGAGILNSMRVVESDSARIMNLLCSEKAQELDTLLSRIEQSVGMLASYTISQLESADKLQNDPDYMESYTQNLESVCATAASNTKGAVAVYVRFNPELTSPTAGLFWSKTALDSSFHSITPTDLSQYSPSDIEHVGWYYIPVKNGIPTWMAPYRNQNIGVRMISYVIPLYKNGKTVGVVGMDIDFDIITQGVANMNIYESGYAFLVDKQATVLYHQELPIGASMLSVDSRLAPVVGALENGSSGDSLFEYHWKEQAKKMAFRSLINGMRLAITAPVQEINEARNELIFQICVATIIISGIAVLWTIMIARKIIKPLRELTAAAQKIADGDLSIPIIHRTADEVGILAESFQQTVNHLQKHIDYINGLAYRDSLTGVKNKTAYEDAVKRMENKMRVERPEYAVLVFDINGLKYINDTYGHDFGDILIINASKIICRTFKHSPVFRIGGDEFVAILEGSDFEHYQELMEELQRALTEHNSTSRDETLVSVARGIAIYEYEQDLSFKTVFKRADDAMYQNKAAMKQAEKPRPR